MDSLRDTETHDITVARWSRPLRVIHLLLAIAVTAQLFIGSFMRDPHAGQPDSFGFMSHEVIGAIILVLIVLHWIWSLTHPAEGIRHLFPWTRAEMRRVVNQLRQAVLKQHLPSGGPADRGLAGFVHGLGLLAISAMVVLGGTFFVSRAFGASRATLYIIKDVHDVGAVVVWIYWGGHLFAAIMHGVLGQPVMQRVFRLRA
ncbi:MAG: cytochrome b/b6 domain-containing protein [Rhodanobacteraceae bacterium]